MKKSEICSSCHRSLPSKSKGSSVPCSEYHKRCVLCDWPVAIKLLNSDGLCIVCTKTKGER